MLAHRKTLGGFQACRKTWRARIAVEELESRNLLSIFTPAQIRHAYGFDQVMFGSVKGNGTGQTIAIVDAFDDPNIANDLKTFDAQFGLPVANFTKATPQGRPRTDAGWSLEISLDVEWAHAIAPGAKILLVEAKTSSFTNLFNAVDYARKQPGVAVVSMSWGSSEASLGAAFETSNDGFFTTPSGHSGVTFVASSGDDGGGPNGPGWPAISPNVLAVGGTSLLLDGQGNYASESGWAGSTGGVSKTELEPNYQKGVQSTGFRTSPDVSIVGDPNTGVYVYTSIPQNGFIGYFQVGGTSAGAPMWAALVAIADQGRAQLGSTAGGTSAALDGFNDTLPALYSMSSSDFHDVTTGANNVASAKVGYDQVTGLGSPKAALVISDLLKVVSKSPTQGTGGGGGGAPGRPRVIASGGQSPLSTTSTSLDATVAMALVRAANSPSPVATSPTMNSAISPPSIPAPLLMPTAAPGATTVGTSMLILGAGDLISDDSGMAGDDGKTMVPAPMVNPPSPQGEDLQVGPGPSLLKQLYDDDASECRWTTAYVAADVPVIVDQSDTETSVTRVSVALAVALGGFWMNVIEGPARRKRAMSAI
jgi:subtilase family serine protease